MTQHDKLHPLPVVFALDDEADQAELAERQRRWSMVERGATLPWPGFAVIDGGKVEEPKSPAARAAARPAARAHADRR